MPSTKKIYATEIISFLKKIKKSDDKMSIAKDMYIYMRENNCQTVLGEKFSNRFLECLREFKLINDNEDFNSLKDKLFTPIGKGTFGKVYKLNNITVEKSMMKYNADENLEDSSIRELCFLSQFSHPNIIEMTKFTIDKETVNLNLPLYGVSLDTWVYSTCYYERCKYLPFIVFQISSVLYYLEQMKFSHGDLKPQNILIDPRNRKIKIIDWGGVCFSHSTKLYETCTYEFAAPEVLNKPENFCIKNDIFSLGLIVKFIIHKTFEDVDDIKNSQEESYELYNGPISKVLDLDFICLVKTMLIINVDSRISSSEVFNSKYFENFRLDSINIKNILPTQIRSNIECYETKMKDVTIQYRKILVQWIFEICQDYDIPRCFSLSVWIMDNYISISTVTSTEIQAVALAAMIITDSMIYGNKTDIQYFLGESKIEKDLLTKTIWDIVINLNGNLYCPMFDLYMKDVDYEILKDIYLDVNNVSKTNKEKKMLYVEKFLIC